VCAQEQSNEEQIHSQPQCPKSTTTTSTPTITTLNATGLQPRDNSIVVYAQEQSNEEQIHSQIQPLMCKVPRSLKRTTS